jgi:hypothetical protein
MNLGGRKNSEWQGIGREEDAHAPHSDFALEAFFVIIIL